MTLDETAGTSANASDQATATQGTPGAASEAGTQGTVAEQPPARTPRKRATRSRTTRAAASASVADDGSGAATTATTDDVATETPAEAASDVSAAPAKRTRAPRKRAAPRPAPRADEAGTEPVAETVAEPGTEPAPEPVAAAVDAPATSGVPAIPAVEFTRDVAPKTPRRRRRSTSPATEPATTTAEPAEAARPAAAQADATQDNAQDNAQDGEQDSRYEAEPEPARAPIVMPLFQAPEPVAPRRRRAASRPAGPPVAPAAAAADAQETAEEQADIVSPVPADLGPVDEVLDDVIDDDVIDDVEDTEDTEDESDENDDAEEEEESGAAGPRRRRRRGGRGRRGRGRGDSEPGAEESGDTAEESGPDSGQSGQSADDVAAADDEGTDPGDDQDEQEGASSRRRRRRRRRGTSGDAEPDGDDPPNTVTRVRESRRDEVTGVRGSTRLEAKKQRRREGREAGRKRTVITEAEFLTRRESVDRVMVVREREGRTQIGVLEDGVLVEHYVARKTQNSMVGNVYLGRVQNVLPSMEAAFVDIGKGRNAVLYAGEVNWDAAGLDGQPRRIEHALTAGEAVLVQVTKDPIGHKGARLTSQISMPGRYLVYVPGGSMTGISRKLPDTERTRLKKILREIVPDEAGVIVRTAAEGASDEELERDVARLQAQWDDIQKKQTSVQAPALLYGEPDLAIRVVRDIFNEDIGTLVVSGSEAWDTLQGYVSHVAPDLASRLQHWTAEKDVFTEYRIDEQLAKALDRKVWLPSGGSLVIDRTEAMTVVDVNTGKFTGSGGNLEETVTKNNLEAAEEVVRQLRLRDIGGIIVVDFIDMVLESNRDLVTRRLLECLGRDRTRHQVAEVTSLGLVQMTRKRVGQGLLEVFSENCEHCGGRGLIVHDEPVEKKPDNGGNGGGAGRRGSGKH